MKKVKHTQPSQAKSLSYKIGMTFIISGFCLPIFVIMIPWLPVSAAMQATLTGFFLIGGPEIFIIIGAGFAGKEAVDTLKNFFRKVFKMTGKPKSVNKTRYQMGLILLLIGMAIPFLVGYVPFVFNLPWSDKTRFILNIIGDVIFVFSFFILGGQFWEKFKRLFVWEQDPNL